jgi:hypothetical protein
MIIPHNPKNFVYSFINPSFLDEKLLLLEICERYKRFEGIDRKIGRTLYRQNKAVDSLFMGTVVCGCVISMLTGSLIQRNGYLVASTKILATIGSMSMVFDYIKVSGCYNQYRENIHSIRDKYSIQDYNPYLK